MEPWERGWMEGKEEMSAFKQSRSGEPLWPPERIEGILVDYIHDFDREHEFNGQAKQVDEMSQT